MNCRCFGDCGHKSSAEQFVYCVFLLGGDLISIHRTLVSANKARTKYAAHSRQYSVEDLKIIKQPVED